jgi:hypothetical protein
MGTIEPVRCFMADEGQSFATPGAMCWRTMTEGPRPAGPDDWDHPDLVKTSPDAKRSPSHTFADGPHLCVTVPGPGFWNIDSRAANCSKPFDYQHRCWVRHGEPPAITVDKAGDTCSPGAGSIGCGQFHGFLRDGVLTGELAD